MHEVVLCLMLYFFQTFFATYYLKTFHLFFHRHRNGYIIFSTAVLMWLQHAYQFHSVLHARLSAHF